MIKKLLVFEIFDYVLLICVSFLVTIGIFFIYSSGVNSEGLSVSNEYVKQTVFASTGFIIMIAFALFDFRKLKRFVFPAFLGLLCVLVYTLIFGRLVNGARSWIGLGSFSIQPSEFGKIVYILFLAWYLEYSENTASLKRFIIALFIMFVPLALILIQPDMGTASVYVPIFLAMIFVAGIPTRYIMLVICTGILTIAFTVLPVWEQDILQKNIMIVGALTDPRLRLIIIIAFASITLIGIFGFVIYKNKWYYWMVWGCAIITVSLIGSIFCEMVLKEYQIMRLIVFLNPDIDPLGSGWNIIQSKIAIGSGGFIGQGFLQGTQSHYRFLPQQSTDFIFSILSEEIGFIGNLIVFILFLILLLRITFIIYKTQNIYGHYVASGILMMFFFHFTVNIGMVMGIMPITGIPLLFLSYGGSSLWTSMWAIGLLMSINYRRLDY